jgi:hypothetical protein
MAPSVPRDVPASLRAGDTWQWDQAFPTYPADEGWTLSFHFRGAQTLNTNTTDVVATDGGWRITIAASRTAGLGPGAYSYTARVTGSGAYAGQTYTAQSGVLRVERDLTQAGDGEVESNWAEKTLEIIDRVLQGRITDDVTYYQIGGRAVTAIPIPELLRLQSRLRREVYQAKHPGQPYVLHSVTLP